MIEARTCCGTDFTGTGWKSAHVVRGRQDHLVPEVLKLPGLMRRGDLEDRLCDIDGSYRMLLQGFPLFLAKGDSGT